MPISRCAGLPRALYNVTTFWTFRSNLYRCGRHRLGNFRVAPRGEVHHAAQVARAYLNGPVVRPQRAAAAVQPVTTAYERGEVIVRSGERVTPWTLRVLEQMNEEAVAYSPLTHWLSLGLLIGCFLAFIERFGVRFISKFRARFNDLLAMAALLLVVTSMAALLSGLGAALNDGSATVPINAYLYLVPVAVGGIITRTLMNAETTLLWALAASVLCAAVSGGDAMLWVYYLGSTLAAAGALGSGIPVLVVPAGARSPPG